jgi:hypothetical protein
MSGIKEKTQFDKVKAALNQYLDEPITTADHEYAAHVYNECRNQGVETGTVDILICAVAVRRGWEVLSGDGGLNRCLAVTNKFHEKQKRTSATEEVKPRRTSVSDSGIGPEIMRQKLCVEIMPKAPAPVRLRVPKKAEQPGRSDSSETLRSRWPAQTPS